MGLATSSLLLAAAAASGTLPSTQFGLLRGLCVGSAAAGLWGAAHDTTIIPVEDVGRVLKLDDLQTMQHHVQWADTMQAITTELTATYDEGTYVVYVLHCAFHCGPVDLRSEDDAYNLPQKLLDGTVHRATVGTVVLLVLMNEKYHRGFPLMLYGSCNRFDCDMMVDLLTGITCAFESPELAARGRIMGLGTDGDARRAAAHIRCLAPSSEAVVVLPGMDQYRTPWGITNFDSPHLTKRIRNALLSVGMVLECGHIICVATIRQLAEALRIEVLQAAYVVRDRMNVALAIKLLRQIGIIARLLADAEVRQNLGRTITLVVISDDMIILAAIVDGFLDGHFDARLSLTTRFDSLAHSALLLMYCRNRYGRPFMAAALYWQMQSTFGNVVDNISWLQRTTPEAKFYISVTGSQPIESTFGTVGTLHHGRTFDILQLRERLMSIVAIQDVFARHPELKQKHRSYLADRLTPAAFTGNNSVSSIRLGPAWRAAITRAEGTLRAHQSIGADATGIFDELFSKGCTLLRPRWAWLWKEMEEETAEDIEEPPALHDDDDQSGAPCDLENFLGAHTQSDKRGQYVQLLPGKQIHVAMFVNEMFNKDDASSSADRLRRTRGESAVSRVLREDVADGVLPGTPYCTLLTFRRQAGKAVTSAAIFGYVETRVDGKKVRAPSAIDLVACSAATVVGEYMPFQDAGEGKLLWTGRYGTEVTVPANAISFVELQLGPNTRWLVETGTLNAFVDTSLNITTCPALQAEPYPSVNTTSVRNRMKTNPCLFCGVDIAVNNMCPHCSCRRAAEAL